MIGYHIRYRPQGRTEPVRVPLDPGSRAEAVAMFKGYRLASGPERRCIQLWRNETLVAGEPVRWAAAAGQMALEVGE